MKQTEGRSSPAGRPARPHRRPARAPAPPTILDPQVRLDPATGERCFHIGTRPGDPNSFLALENELRAMRLQGSMPRCGRAHAPAPPRPSPGAVALQVWRDEMPLPRPEPTIAPGKAITGKEAFLEIGGAESATVPFSVFGYDLTLTALALGYDVDWGDGTWSRNVRSRGGPWPHGDVRHTYTTEGTYRVRVIQHWTATWSMPAVGGGAVPGTLSTEGMIPELRVVQVQAVRNR